MKRILVLILFSVQLLAQDTIYFRNKDIKAVKVEEIGLSEIKYHAFDNLQGPVYIVAKSDIFRIKFPNGKADTFSVATPKIESPSVIVNKDVSPSVEKIEIFKSKLRYEDRGLNDKAFVNLLLKYPFPETKRILLRDFNMVKTYKNKHNYGLGLLAGGILLQLFGSGYNPALFVVGAGVGITGSVMANVNKNKAKAKRVEIARKYNEWK